jgi:hypothetical protein
VVALGIGEAAAEGIAHGLLRRRAGFSRNLAQGFDVVKVAAATRHLLHADQMADGRDADVYAASALWRSPPDSRSLL